MNGTKGFSEEQKFAMHWGVAKKLHALMCYLEETPEIDRETLMELVNNELQMAIASRDKVQKRHYEAIARENRTKVRFG